MTELCGIETHWQVLFFVAWMFFERWLGRTDKLKAGSTVDLIATMVVALIIALFKRRNDGKTL